MPLSRFAAHAELVDLLLARREHACDLIDRRLLNVKDKPASRIRERRYFDETLASCVFEGLPRDAATLDAELAAAHAADGFEPFLHRGSPHQLDPAELIVRAYEHWDRSRWPGAGVRQPYARTVWGVFVLHRLQHLALRACEEDSTERLRTVQRLLDALNACLPSGGLVRDARWLLQVAQGPLTKGLTPYFRVAAAVAGAFNGEDAIAIHAAGAKLAGGHLRSQVCHRAAELSQPPDGPEVLAVTRNSNAMDVALLVWDLVPLLEAYATASAAGDRAARRSLADAILQGVSADPDLLLVRLDLLGPCTAIETVFVQRTGGRPALTTTGAAHAARRRRYATLVDELAPSLCEDASASDPSESMYSPLALVYGFCGDLLANMASAPIRGPAASGVALEDLFLTGGDPACKTARSGLTLSPDWARALFARTRAAIERRASHRGRANASGTRDARILLVPADAAADGQEYCVMSDVNLAMVTGATAFPRGQITIDRDEGRFLASAETGGRWFGVSKMVLTERIAHGEDATISVPEEVSQILRLTCPALIGARG